MSRLARLNAHFGGRVLTSLVLMILSFQPYWYLNNHLLPRYDLSLPIDRALPFWPWTMVIYQSFFLMLLVAAWVCPAREYLRILAGVLLANLMCYAGFVLWTSHYPRPSCTTIESAFWREIFCAIFAKDAPGNTFPSIHVSVTLLVTLRMLRRAWPWFWLLWGALICLSTLTVKQHFVVDLLGGMVVALVLHTALFKEAPWRSKFQER